MGEDSGAQPVEDLSRQRVDTPTRCVDVLREQREVLILTRISVLELDHYPGSWVVVVQRSPYNDLRFSFSKTSQPVSSNPYPYGGGLGASAHILVVPHRVVVARWCHMRWRWVARRLRPPSVGGASRRDVYVRRFRAVPRPCCSSVAVPLVMYVRCSSLPRLTVRRSVPRCVRRG